MDDIKLFNPNDKPFGKLSNNAYHPMTIDGKSYPTVTNYILSNMMTTPMWKTILQNTQFHTIYSNKKISCKMNASPSLTSEPHLFGHWSEGTLYLLS